MIPFFVLGFYLAKYCNCFRYRKLIFPVAFLLWGFLLNFYSKDTYIYTTGFTILGKSGINAITTQLIIDLYRYAIGIVGVVSVACIMYLIYECVGIVGVVSVACIMYLIYECVGIFKIHGAIWIYKLIEHIGKDSIRYYVLSTYMFVWIVPNITYSLASNYL